MNGEVLLLAEQIKSLAMFAAAILLGFAVTAVALLWFARKTVPAAASFRVFGLFYGLSARERLRLAFSYARLLFLIACVLLFQPLQAAHYAMYFLFGFGFLCFSNRVKQAVSGVVNLLLELLGIVTVNILCGYLTDRRFDWMYFALYTLMSVFLILLGVYLFLQEVDEISRGRSNAHAITANI